MLVFLLSLVWRQRTFVFQLSGFYKNAYSHQPIPICPSGEEDPSSKQALVENAQVIMIKLLVQPVGVCRESFRANELDFLLCRIPRTRNRKAKPIAFPRNHKALLLSPSIQIWKDSTLLAPSLRLSWSSQDRNRDFSLEGCSRTVDGLDAALKPKPCKGLIR